MRRLVDLAARVQEGIDYASKPLEPLLAAGRATDNEQLTIAIEKLYERVTEADLWLGRVIELSAIVLEPYAPEVEP